MNEVFLGHNNEKEHVHVGRKHRVCGKEVESVGHVENGCTGFVPSIGGDVTSSVLTCGKRRFWMR